MRRMLLAWLALLAAWAAPALAQAPGYSAVRPGLVLTFPSDHGAHPGFRTEWWYVTGWLKTESGEDLGFQVTFFRSRPPGASDNPSAFAPRQILFAHAAISDPVVGKLMHGQRIARAGFGLAEAQVGDADLVIDDWRLRRGADGRFATKVAGEGFTLDLTFTPTQPVLLQGEAGFSRKGPLASQASYYYSLPQLKASGTVRRGGKAVKVTGTAWLDREWSSTLLDPSAVGWDWVGLNLDDGGALMAFRLRGADDSALWSAATLRSSAGPGQNFPPAGVAFAPLRHWRSPRTGIVYPVAWQLRIGRRVFELQALFDDQELDSRRSTGAIYWEGAVRLFEGGREIGRGYLEMTGYGEPMRLG